MTREEYSEYLWGRRWRRLRMKLRRQTDFCELCDLPLPRSEGDCLAGGWEVHHWTYANLGHEKREDLSVLCEACHTDAHAVLDGREPGLVRHMHYEDGPCTLRAGVEYINRDRFVDAVHRKQNLAIAREIADRPKRCAAKPTHFRFPTRHDLVSSR